MTKTSVLSFGIAKGIVQPISIELIMIGVFPLEAITSAVGAEVIPQLETVLELQSIVATEVPSQKQKT